MKVPSVARRAYEFVERDRMLVYGLCLAFGLRLALLPWFSDPLNFFGYSLTTSFVSHGQNPWIVIHSDPALNELNPWGYPPLYFLVTLPSAALSFGNGYVFGLWVRIPLVFADLATAVLAFKIGRERGLGLDRARWLALFYVFNPLVVLVSAVWGTNDPLPVTCVTAALYFHVRKKPNNHLAAILLGQGVAFKIYPLVLVPIFLAGIVGWRHRLKFAALTALPFIATAGPLLVSTPQEFLSTVGLFAVGSVATGDGTYLSIWWVLRSLINPPDPRATLAAGTVFIAAVLVLSRFVAKGRVSAIRGCALVLGGLFLILPRYSQSYALWAFVPLLIATTLEPPRRKGGLVTSLLWVPLAVGATIYNGASGVTGLPYWSLISAQQRLRLYAWLPPYTLEYLQIGFIVLLAISVVTLGFLPSRSREPNAVSPFAGRCFAFLDKEPRHSAKVAVLSVVLFCLLAGSVGLVHGPVAPEDFSRFEVGGERTVVVSEFEAVIFDFTWNFGGTGRFDQPSHGGIVLDTLVAGATSFIHRSIPGGPLEARAKVKVERLLDPPVMQIMNTSAGAVWIEPDSPGGSPMTFSLHYIDRGSRANTWLGSASLGETLEIRILTTPDFLIVRHKDVEAVTVVEDRIDQLSMGQQDGSAGGGGALLVDRVEISWPTSPRAADPVPVSAMVGLSAAMMAVPVFLIRYRRS